ncbi:desmoglein-2.1 [Pholidichthys leucotaenia]
MAQAPPPPSGNGHVTHNLVMYIQGNPCQQDSTTPPQPIPQLTQIISTEPQSQSGQKLKRVRRHWLPPPAKLVENIDYNDEVIAKIRSDKDETQKVEYFLTGEGANKPPYNLFVVNHENGDVKITGKLDREKCDKYHLKGIARYENGSYAEDEIPLVIMVLDQNDNAPYFEPQSGTITESSKKGTFVLQIEGKDDDQDGTLNSKIAYSIDSQEPKGNGPMFYIEQDTGKVYIKEPTLDRETIDSYTLVVKGVDMDGAPGGLSGTGTIHINVTDINDNLPTLEENEYSGKVDENVHNVVVMRIRALDEDLEGTDNWLTRFKIAKGNEDNLFSIETDEKTNEGILTLIKPLDFEEVQNLALALEIENYAPFVEGGSVMTDVNLQVGEGGTPIGAGFGLGGDVGGGMGGDADIEGEVGLDLGLGGGVDAGLGVDAGTDIGAGIGGALGPGVGLKPHVGPITGPELGLKPGIKPGGKKTKPKKPGPKSDAPKSYPIMISVNNMPEGPSFVPSVKEFPVSEDPKEAPEGGTIGTFAAINPDTGKPAEDVSYAKGYDPGNWLVIDEETAEIKLKVPDRESPFVVNGTYIAKILAISKDMPAKTATGTIAIKVIDSNDHCPTLEKAYTHVCYDPKGITVTITGKDEDAFPNAAPFTFVTDDPRGEWRVTFRNETTVSLESSAIQKPDKYNTPYPYTLKLEVIDVQGLSCPEKQSFTINVCEFIPFLLVFCQCGGKGTVFPDQFSDMPFDTKEHLISYHTEGIGEDKV